MHGYPEREFKKKRRLVAVPFLSTLSGRLRYATVATYNEWAYAQAAQWVANCLLFFEDLNYTNTRHCTNNDFSDAAS